MMLIRKALLFTPEQLYKFRGVFIQAIHAVLVGQDALLFVSKFLFKTQARVSQAAPAGLYDEQLEKVLCKVWFV